MRLRRLTLKGITRFDQAEVDFTTLPEGLIAIAGANGAGKTTILEAPFAALHLEFPTRPGSVYGVAHGRDARLELELENGQQPYRALVAIDAQAQKTEAYLYDGAGKPVTGGKVRDFGAAVAKRFGSPRLMLSAALSAQNKRGSFLDLSKVDRKALLAEILDTEGLQVLAEAARAKAKAGELALERLRGQLAETEAELARAGEATPTENLAATRARLEAEIATGQVDLEAARAEYSDLQTRHALAVEAEGRRTAVEREAVDLGAAAAGVREKLAGIPTERDRAQQRAAAAIAAAEAEAADLPKCEQADRDLGEAKLDRLGRAAAVEAAERLLRSARDILLERTKATGGAAALKTRLGAAQRQAGLLGEVPCTNAGGMWRMALAEGEEDAGLLANLPSACPLLADARSAREAITSLEADLAEVAAAEARLPEYQQVVDRQEEDLRDARAALDGVDAEITRLAPMAARLGGAKAAQQRAVDARLVLTETLATLDAREAEYREQLDALAAKREALAAELAAMEKTNPAAIKADLDAAARRGQDLRRRVDELQAELRTAEAAITRAEAEAQRRAELQQRAGEAREQLAGLEAGLGDWVTLERALGRDGIQALEIDAAGPELSSTTNDLLTSTFGPRFELKFITQAPKTSDKGSMKEVFEVAVIDHDRGREGAVESFSGGEKVIISEAISLALAIYCGKHSGRQWQTMFRDETAGALDPDNAVRYLAMLRRARVLAGAHHIIFVAQQPELWSAADSVLWVEDGRVEVRS